MIDAVMNYEIDSNLIWLIDLLCLTTLSAIFPGDQF